MSVSNAGQLPWDPSWFRHINSLTQSTSWLNTPMRLYAELGVYLFAAILLWSWWEARRSGQVTLVAAALWAPLGTLLAVAANQPIVSGVKEARPYDALSHVTVLVSRSTDYSFPSDHAVMAGAVTAGVLLAHRKIGLVALAAALAMCLARVYVGAHYPGDVMAGLLVGAVVTIVGYLATKGVLCRLVTWAANNRLRPLVTALPAPGAPLDGPPGERRPYPAQAP